MSDIFEVYRSLPLMSLQDATVQDGEGHRSCLLLVFERNEVKARFSDRDSASKLHSIILASTCVHMCVRCVSVDRATPPCCRP